MPCEEGSYTYSVSYNQFLGHRASAVRNHLSPGNGSRLYEWSKVHIYFAENSYMLVEEVSIISPNSVLGNIGGLLGIYLGASLMSVLQVLIYSFKRILWRLS